MNQNILTMKSCTLIFYLICQQRRCHTFSLDRLIHYSNQMTPSFRFVILIIALSYVFVNTAMCAEANPLDSWSIEDCAKAFASKNILRCIVAGFKCPKRFHASCT
ncbi:unnamed protein product [Adineta ricciae]|uniref:Uncharacterized protein n=1 Tax=Adineta ricciae TaxID=249248 RepID=A0A813NEU7_ADIRI|nr:unnamed protein product [Adineta ricciae]